jgi:two-component system sensor histidine kinase FlrB
VTREAALEGEVVSLRGSDGGKGVPPELVERLFDPFFTTRAEGTGLGLAIVRNVAEAHSGRVTVESTPGQGSVFTLYLPVARAEQT